MATEKVWNINGIETDVIQIKGNGDGSHCLIFIPGNPGLGHYYIPFLEAIHKGLEHFDIVCCSYPGHTPTSQLHSLDEQIAHKIDFIDWLSKIYPFGTKYYLAAHSLGTYISIQILKARPSLEFIKIISLFPTMHSMGSTPNAQKIKPLTFPISRLFLRTVAHTLSFFPKTVLTKIMNSVSTQSTHAMDVSLKYLLHHQTVNSVLYLASCEFEQIKELDEEVVDQFQDKWIMYFSDKDGWAPIDHYHFAKQRFPNAKVYSCDQVEHAFVMEHSEFMALKVIDWLS